MSFKNFYILFFPPLLFPSPPLLHVFAGNSRICLPDYFHNRDISEDYCLRPGHAPELLRQERLEHAGLCHRHSRVSSRGGTGTSAAHAGTLSVYWQPSSSRPSIILLLGSLSACPVAMMTARVQHAGMHMGTHMHTHTHMQCLAKRRPAGLSRTLP